MKKISALTVSLMVIFLLTSCAGMVELKVPGISGGKIQKKKKASKVKPVMFEDFEAGAAVGAYQYANGAGGAYAEKFMAVTDDVHSGTFSAKATFNTGNDPAWGCGLGTQSAYGGGYIDCKGTETLSIWVKGPPGKTFYFFVNEAQDNGADGEFWNTPDQMTIGKWKEYIIPVDLFYKNIYSGNQEGNNSVDLSAVGTVGLQFAGAQGESYVYIDDIWFR